MNRIAILLSLVICTFCTLLAQPPRRDGNRQPLNEEQIAQMIAQHTDMVKKQLQLSAEQEPAFNKEYANYNHIVLATRTLQFKNRIDGKNNADETVAAINDAIDSQLAELVAKKQMINNLKAVLTAEQLAKLNMLTNGFAPGMRKPGGKDFRNKDTQSPRQRNRNNEFSDFQND